MGKQMTANEQVARIVSDRRARIAERIGQIERQTAGEASTPAANDPAAVAELNELRLKDVRARHFYSGRGSCPACFIDTGKHEPLTQRTNQGHASLYCLKCRATFPIEIRRT